MITENAQTIKALPFTNKYLEPWPVYCLKHKRRVQSMPIEQWVERSIVFVGYVKNDKFKIEGTGFIAGYEQGGKRFLNVITCQHVFLAIQKHSNQVIVRYNAPTGAVHASIDLEDFYFHPDADRYVDVAVAPVGLDSEWGYAAVLLNIGSATKEVMKELSIGAGDEIFMAGYFRYHGGVTKNLPIVRTGNIASIPDEPLKTNSGDMNGYLIECRSIGGLSGSPVFVNMPAIRIIESKASFHHGLRHYLLGMVHGHFDENDDGLKESAARLDGVNVGIGVVTPVEDILDIMRDPYLVEKRQMVIDSLDSSSKNLKEDAASQSELTDQEGDDILKTMLNTPPKPLKGN